MPNSSTSDWNTNTTVAVCHWGASASASGSTTNELRSDLLILRRRLPAGKPISAGGSDKGKPGDGDRVPGGHE